MNETKAAARRYARAAFELAREEGQLDAVSADLESLRGLLLVSPELTAFMTNPVLPTEQMVKTLETLFASRVHPLTYRFLRFLESRDRLDLIADVCESFSDYYLELKGIVRVQITSAVPLSDKQVAGIVAAMRTRLGREPLAAVDTDRSLIGGFRVRAGDTIYDYSIATQLESLKKRIISA